MPIPDAPAVQRVMVSREEAGQIVRVFQFKLNPTGLKWGLATNYVDLRAPGTASSQAMFVNVGDRDLTLAVMLLDHVSGQGRHSVANGVGNDMAEIESWMLPSLDRFAASQFEFIPPPQLILSWGRRSWRCTARRVDVDETMHDADLNPIAASLTINLRTHTESFTELQGVMATLQRYRDQGFGL